MSNVTLSVVVPSVEIIFDDDTAAIQTAVDADTVLGVTPGTVGLEILAATTADEVLTIAGAVGPAQVESITRNQFSAHAMGVNPHPSYVRVADITALAEYPGVVRQAISAHAKAVHPHLQYAPMDQVQMANSTLANLVMSHATSTSSHPDRPTFDQSILASSFFGS